MTEHKHNWTNPEMFTVDMRQERAFKWCIECGTLHFYGVEHKPALESQLARLTDAAETAHRYLARISSDSGPTGFINRRALAEEGYVRLTEALAAIEQTEAQHGE